MAFTIKNYRHRGGLSYRFYEPNQGDAYEVKGPLGKDLNLSSTGVHLAFAAGTGLLCFIDMVAHLALANLGVIGDPEETVNLEQFKLKLFVSFGTREESIGLALVEALHHYCNMNGRKNFELHLRLSKEGVNSKRWDQTFIDEQVNHFNLSEIKKVMVCGPPVMNETFDRAFQDISSKDGLKLDSSQYEIL